MKILAFVGMIVCCFVSATLLFKLGLRVNNIIEFSAAFFAIVLVNVGINFGSWSFDA